MREQTWKKWEKHLKRKFADVRHISYFTNSVARSNGEYSRYNIFHLMTKSEIYTKKIVADHSRCFRFRWYFRISMVQGKDNKIGDHHVDIHTTKNKQTFTSSKKNDLHAFHVF